MFATVFVGSVRNGDSEASRLYGYAAVGLGVYYVTLAWGSVPDKKGLR